MRILVADDDEVSALVLSERLEDLGYQVSVARDGAEAWSHMQQADYRLLILDWMMPIMDGMELCRRVRQQQSDSYTYIILLTGRTDRRDRLEALEGGADDFLTKPLDQAEFLARLKAAARVLSSDEALRLSNHELQLARLKELEIGAHIQQRLLYSPPPTSVQAIRTASLSIPSQSVDGDFCDFFELSDGAVDVVVGDVMGKGVPAAMVGAGVKTNLQRSLLRLLVKDPDSLPRPADLIRDLAGSVSAELIELNTFLTLCYARFDARRNKLAYVNCGHPKIIHWRARAGAIELLETTAVPLGFSDEAEYEEREVDLEPGDLILFYSDGITDLHQPEGGRLGIAGFAEWVAPRAHLPLEDLIAELVCLRDASLGEGLMRDDFTCVAVRFVGSEVANEDGLSLWADSSALRKVRSYLDDLIRATPFQDRDRAEILLAVQEAASNAINHARKGHHALPLHVQAKTSADSLRIDLRYPGVPFDATEVPPPVLDGSQDSGFGVAIIRKCMDLVTFGVDKDLNHVVLEKRYPR
ncbi:ATP-binding SpoIIE family protein phosphatase [Fimbriimonas ginsengisoli]|uniref:Protein serine/threonine phosphatase n=1 Tax=Fimbriimonas ginsengisoli Gsoil 348 TaxID=661478 RepID=A0A068NTY3_FIMGI|nr:SpoIIE family protein phosphatase [Fimbriimonas ginsengisoli]AIE86901.1 protein serine/threonine phosphatase [Fimbriimonas ginsengisoli Gsoil 348]